MDGRDWQATVHAVAELDTTEGITLTTYDNSIIQKQLPDNIILSISTSGCISK